VQRLVESRNQSEHRVDHRQKADQLQSSTFQMTPHVAQGPPGAVPKREALDLGTD
jgi:hypothetical protein